MNTHIAAISMRKELPLAAALPDDVVIYDGPIWTPWSERLYELLGCIDQKVGCIQEAKRE